jgi:predicted phosphoribosyltransferase
METHVDRLVCLDTPQRFQAVGQFYASFPQLSDGEVIQLLSASR